MKQKLTLPASLRISRQKHFSYIYQCGRKIENRYMRIYIAPKLEMNPRMAVVASKRNGNSVQRHFLKRRLRELFRLNQHKLDRSVDMVIIAKSYLGRVDFSECHLAFEGVLRANGYWT